MKSIRTGFALAAICVVCLGVTDTRAQQPYYKDKRLTVLINVAPGGAHRYRRAAVRAPSSASTSKASPT